MGDGKGCHYSTWNVTEVVRGWEMKWMSLQYVECYRSCSWVGDGKDVITECEMLQKLFVDGRWKRISLQSVKCHRSCLWVGDGKGCHYRV